MKSKLKTIEVVAAIIIDNNKILATKRGYGEFSGGWEFPGGKIEKGETKEEALKREIREELSIDININNFFYRVEYDYQTFHLTMDCYICSIRSGDLTLNEHSDYKWLAKHELDKVNWLPADVDLIKHLKENLNYL
ncbi:MAG: 8-oxo-dGTP diphosphatase MutT [Clostridiales bacterium]|mgnify:CR=1 FL=1|nr:8-oxo-dGTP diphosphatase MutT [Clostridiales bacterium]